MECVEVVVQSDSLLFLIGVHIEHSGKAVTMLLEEGFGDLKGYQYWYILICTYVFYAYLEMHATYQKNDAPRGEIHCEVVAHLNDGL
jgi:hypothetical protein